MYRIQQFAQLSGVTVRTLHHYDRMGLLSPKARSESGYRLYSNADLGRMERILLLRYLGLSLREIAELLAGELAAGRKAGLPTLGETLERQTALLRERRAGLDRVLRAVALVQRQLSEGREADWALCQTILKEINMQSGSEWTRKYYTPEAQEILDARAGEWSPELQEKVTAEWQVLFADVQNALDRRVDPKSEEGKELAARWGHLVGQFTSGNPQVAQGLNEMYKDRSAWEGKMDPAVQRNLPKREHLAFIAAAKK